ncbi:uncharacterized protein LOC129752352 [Uranotaenia lowii]|uniref:uncharacterized protein LOC129752352 n=1 Tax=Uranotaenia lowii TaxID=190385 RepID=UPI00247AD660|nr:uncharacterized protein LOC129752352 [Uranotaenia lowii]
MQERQKKCFRRNDKDHSCRFVVKNKCLGSRQELVPQNACFAPGRNPVDLVNTCIARQHNRMGLMLESQSTATDCRTRNSETCHKSACTRESKVLIIPYVHRYDRHKRERRKSTLHDSGKKHKWLAGGEIA